MITIKETIDLSSSIYEDALTLRKEVFVFEQQVPIELEIENEKEAIHFVLYESNLPQATVRLLPKENRVYKIQRMAVKKEARKKGFGRMIMTFVEDYAKENQIKELVLGAQTQAIPFYQGLNYTIFGDEYLDAGIKHFDMKKQIDLK